ncbi:Ldh family oxidoreductase [Microbacterium sp. 179-I 3D3 NHS]|uniref:Ldh family oxidoreductase n=1 Tax=unclassified Microbacterium TaxID=2609290 RepID=UPI00399FCB13
MSSRTHRPEALLSKATAVLTALGTPPDAASEVAEALVGANLVGHDSHGIVRLREYAAFVARGVVEPGATPSVVSSLHAVQVVDGRRAWGQISARFAADLAARTAGEFGVAAVSIRNCNHIGRIGEYAEILAARGYASLLWCNADPAVAPFGGTERMLGTNPLAVGIPVAGGHPFILDFATSATAEGKLRVARASGRDVEPGAVITREGTPSTDPEAFYAGGALLPFGGHKGYGLSVFIELLGGGLSGNHPGISARYRAGNGVMMVAMKPEAFAAMDFEADIRETIDALRASRPADPTRPVLIPGDVEDAQRHDRSAGIPVDDAIWADVEALHAELLAAQQ